MNSGGSQKQYTPPTGSLERDLNQVPATANYEDERDAKFMSAALHCIEHNPGPTITRDLKKLGMTLTLDVYDHRSRNVLYVGSWLILLVLGILGASRRRGEFAERVLLLVFLVYALAVPTIFFTLARYKLSVEITLLLFAGCGLSDIEQRVRSALAKRRERTTVMQSA